MRQIDIEIETTDRDLPMGIFGASTYTTGNAYPIKDDANITYHHVIRRKAVGMSSVFVLTLKWGGRIATSVIAAWLYDKLKDKDITLRLNKNPIDIDPDSLLCALEKVQDEKDN